MSRKIFRLLETRLTALALLVATSVLFLEHSAGMDAPFVIYFLVAGAWAIIIAVLSRREFLRKAALLCGSALFCLAVVETYVYYTTKSQVIITRTTQQAWRRDTMGFGDFPVPNMAIEFKQFLNGRMIGDVTYRIDANGLREIPNAVQGRPYEVAFFGCSFMFGHGVEDDQTVPYYFLREARGTFEGFNFAGEGWGPHQMLREVETGFIRRVAGAPDLAIYEAIPDHLRRVAGRAPWESGPKYELCRSEEACYAGPFHSTYYETSRRWLDKSWTGKFIENYFANLSRPSDIPLFLAVLKKTRSLLEQNGTRLIIVLWDQNELAKTMLKTLRANQFDVIALSSIFPDGDLKTQSLTQADRHPSPATNQAIATYLWEHVGGSWWQSAQMPLCPMKPVLRANQKPLGDLPDVRKLDFQDRRSTCEGWTSGKSARKRPVFGASCQGKREPILEAL
ncbi:MAG TPA: hypothetical protein VGY99_30010 [Candidatus Binataceae bacterium]|jgi:hypothetical protein|nr:hypothetical protein [Candidatus Binataceae bacterium]